MEFFEDHNIFIFNYPFDLELLNQTMLEFEDKFKPYTEDWLSFDSWLIAKRIKFDYADKLMEIFNIKAKPRFYIQKANSKLPLHKDVGTLCSINILLTKDKLAPVVFGDGKSYIYNSCLLNTQNEHTVATSDEDRLLFKLSIQNEDFKTVIDKIKKVI